MIYIYFFLRLYLVPKSIKKIKNNNKENSFHIFVFIIKNANIYNVNFLIIYKRV